MSKYEQLNRDRAEDVAWMAATGECLTGAAQRLGVIPKSLDRWCRDHGMQAELTALLSREPGNPSQTDRTQRAVAARWAS